MKSTLLKSLLFVTAFWWIVFAAMWITEPLAFKVNAVNAVHWLFPWMHIEIPSTANWLNNVFTLSVLYRYWMIPILLLSLSSAAISFAVVGIFLANAYFERAYREKPVTDPHGFAPSKDDIKKDGQLLCWARYALLFCTYRIKDRLGHLVKVRMQWRGAGITIGMLPAPASLRKTTSTLFRESFPFLDDKYFELLTEILQTLEAYPDAFVGDGHATSLYSHTVNVLSELLKKTKDPQAIVVAAAHDIGKITAYVRSPEGTWVRARSKWHDKESAYQLALLPSFFELTEKEQKTILLAVKYGHTPGDMAEYSEDPSITKDAMHLLDLVHTADMQATKAEKQRVLDQADLPAIALDAFISGMTSFIFQRPKLNDLEKQKAAGWKKENRIYLLEIQIREQCLALLDADLRAALGTTREKTEISPFTAALLKAFDQKGWLVKQFPKYQVAEDNKTVTLAPQGGEWVIEKAEEALWTLHSGTKDFNGVIVVDLPKHLIEMLESANTTYDVYITKPHKPKADTEALAIPARVGTGAAPASAKPETSPGTKPAQKPAAKPAPVLDLPARAAKPAAPPAPVVTPAAEPATSGPSRKEALKQQQLAVPTSPAMQGLFKPEPEQAPPKGETASQQKTAETSSGLDAALLDVFDE